MAAKTQSLTTIPNDRNFYKPLNPAKHDIRLLVLWPTQYWNGCDPRCCLVRTSLTNDTSRYDALSYCWGDLNDTKSIKIEHTEEFTFNRRLTDGLDQYARGYQRDPSTDTDEWFDQSQQLGTWLDRLPDKGKYVSDFHVTTSLYNYLKRKPVNTPHLLWVDAVCINQSDLHERSHQIEYMREIYKRAFTVIIWLGNEASGDDPNILWEMEELCLSCTRFSDRLNSVRSANVRLTVDEFLGSQQTSTFVPHFLKFYYEDGPITETLRGYYERVCKFFSHPWFRRIWVLQEVRNSQRKIVSQENQGGLWRSITSAAQFSQQLFNSLMVEDSGKHSYLPDIWNEIVYGNEPIPLLVLVFGTREFGATDPRDKLLALLGIAAETSCLESLPTEIRAGYCQTKTQFYTDFTSWLITLQMSLDVLSAVFHPQQIDVPHGSIENTLPSWVPDYNGRIPPAGMTIGFSAKYRASDDRPVRRYGTNQPGMLRLEGVEIGRLSDLIAGEFCGQPLNSDFILLATFDDKFEFLGHRGVLPVLPFLWHALQRAGDKAISVETLFRTLTCCISTEVNENANVSLPFRTVISREFLWEEFVLHWNKFDTEQFPRDSAVERVNNFAELALVSCGDRSLFLIPERGAICLCPKNALPNDLVVILFGGNVPYVLRERLPSPELIPGEQVLVNPIYEFIGECYVDGYMDGSILRNIDQGKIFDIF
ncbi:uncharacterized protein PAC_17623 [Phialocephala subalpina]|uniref:Heterokaryon incompatibility domain-containing protein n=1 Tax=Phialocephala subalpina TaxID=576137 RepID=A0A1L7XRQ2_9HELO|nr:uncharacterized protein PAC_17623 [Phialocephala subalpina]